VVVILQEHFCLLTDTWLEDSLHEINIVTQLFSWPNLLVDRLDILLDAASIQDEISFLDVVINIMLIKHYEDEIESRKETAQYTCVGLEVILRVPLLHFDRVGGSDYGSPRVDLAYYTSLGYA
jgi:hypothetical protein